MTTKEKLLLQIFERKKKIIDQVKHHALLFDHHLAFKLLIDGINPPPWLSTSECNEVDALSKGLDAGYETSVFPPQSNIAGCASNGLPAVDHHTKIWEGQPDEDPSISSPQDQGGAAISDSNPDPLLSLAKIQRSKSRQRALQIRNSAKKDKLDENNVRACVGCISVSGISSLQSEKLVEGNGVNPLDRNNEDCAAEDVKVGTVDEVKVGNCLIKEKGSTICPNNTVCNKSLEQEYLLSTRSSSHAIRGEVAPSADSTESTQQPNLVNQSMLLVNHSNTSNKILRAAEEKSGDFQSNDEKGSSNYYGRITRSRSSTQQANCTNELFKLNLSSNNWQKDDFNSLIQQPNLVDCMEVVKSVEITNENTDKKAKNKGCQIKKNGLDDYSGRITRSRSSSQPCNTAHYSQNMQESPLVQKNIELCPSNRKIHFSKENSTKEYGSGIKDSQSTFSAEKVISAVTSNIPDQILTHSMLTASNKSHKARDTSISAERSSLQKEDIRVVSSTDSSCKENVADKFPGRTESVCSIEGISMPFKSKSLGRGVTQSRSAASDMPVQARSFNRFEGIMTCDEVKDQHSNSISEFVHQNRCAAKPVEADSICLGYNLDGADFGVTHEAVPSRTSTNSTMHVEPKQLDFNIVEEPCSNGIPAPVSRKEKQDRISGKRLITLSEPSYSTNKEICTSIPEKGNLPLDMLLLEQQEALNKDGSSIGLTEALAGKINEAMGPLDRFSASPVKEMSDAHKDAVSHPLPKSEKTSKERFDLADNSTNVQVSRENFPRSIPRKEGEVTLNGMEMSANAPCASMQEVEVSLISSLTRQAPGDSQADVMMEARLVNPTSFINNEEKQWALNGNRVPFCQEANSKLGCTEPWSSAERCLQEERSHLEVKNKFPNCSVSSLYSQSFGMIGTDDTMPVLEGFIMQTDDEQPCTTGEGIIFDELKLPKTTIGRAGILERLCKSACMQTPGSCSSAMYKLYRDLDLYQSVPTGLLEGMGMRNKVSNNDSFDQKNNDTFEQLKDKYDCLNEVSQDSLNLSPGSNSQSARDLSKPCISPVSKLWDRITTISASSEKRGSLNPELPCIEEEIENIEEVADTYQESLVSDAITNSAKREPLADITENLNCPASEALSCADRYSFDSTNTVFSLTKNFNMSNKKLINQNSSKRALYNKEKKTTAQGEYGGKRATGSFHDRSSKPPKFSGKNSLRKGGPSFSEVETAHNNIVSNITSFVPLVQQKQAAAVVTGKKDIKVKALEAAEAAKRRAEKKENERKLKKEALKLERTRLEQENLKQIELQKKRKEEERKKKEADMAAKKREREEEERKEKRKRMRFEESRRQQREQEQKLRSEKEKRRAIDEGGRESKKSKVELEKQKKTAKVDVSDSLRKTSETESLNSRLSTSDKRRAGTVNKQFEASSDFGNNTTVLGEIDKPKVNDTLVASTSQDQSYEISPYKASDDEDEEDEDEEDEDLTNKKYVPSWASKNCLALVVSSQTRIDPEVIFPPESFCSITEVLLPRKLQIK